MGKGATVFNYETAESALGILRENAYEPNELSVFETAAGELETITKPHDNYLQGDIAKISGGGEIISSYETVNNKYMDFIDKLVNAIERLHNVDANGKPKNEGKGSNGGNSTASPSSSVSSSSTPEASTPPENTVTPTSTTVGSSPTDSQETSAAQTTGATTGGNQSDNQTDAVGTSDAQTVGATTGGNQGNNTTSATGTPEAAAVGAVVGAAIGSDDIIGGQGSPDGIDSIHDNNPFGSYNISSNTINNMTDTEKEALKNKLKELGYSDSEIDEIINGGGSVPGVQVDSTAEALEEAIKKHPELRNELMSKYGFDIFNEDGTVNKERLGLALMMDNKNGNNAQSLYDLLQTQYGINIVNPTDFTNLSSRLEILLSKYPDLRQKVIDKYGFDIFNADGTINKDKLALAMMMDNQSGTDDFDLLAFLINNYGEEGATALQGNVTKPIKAETVKKSGTRVVPIAASLGLLGAIGGGTALLIKKKKEEEEENEDDNFDDELIEDPTAVVDDRTKKDLEAKPESTGGEKEWLHGLGIGLSATDSESTGASTYSVNEPNYVTEEEESGFTNLDKILAKKAAEEENKVNYLPFLAAGIGAGAARKVAKELLEKDKNSSDDEMEGIE